MVDNFLYGLRKSTVEEIFTSHQLKTGAVKLLEQRDGRTAGVAFFLSFTLGSVESQVRRHMRILRENVPPPLRNGDLLSGLILDGRGGFERLPSEGKQARA